MLVSEMIFKIDGSGVEAQHYLKCSRQFLACVREGAREFSKVR